jgi:hypothetical protein
MEAQFVVHFAFNGIPPKQRSQSKQDVVEHFALLESFVAQGGHGVGAHGPACREISRKERHGSEQTNRGSHGQGITRGQSEEQFLKHSHGRQRNCNASSDAT